MNDRGEFFRKLLEQMLLIRRFEEKSAQLYGLRKIGGFCHLYIGQEAVAVGAIAAIDLTKDYVLTAYRDHGHALAVGMEPEVLMAELLGKATGCSKGKGGSMHFFDAKRHFLGGNGIVGAHIPIATGVAVKIKYLNEEGCVLCFFGDGAIHQGVFHESLNMAKIWKLPVVYIVENNQYGMVTHFNRVSAVGNLASKGCAYKIPGEQVDGMDVVKVFEATRKAAALAKEKGMPSLLEMKTYRYLGHSMTDPAKYRTQEELEAQKKHDPILFLKAQMLKDGTMGEEEFKKMDEEIKSVVAKAVKFAEESPEAALEAMYEDLMV